MTHKLRRRLAAGFLFSLTCVGFEQVQAQEVVRSTYTYKMVGDLRIRADVYLTPDDVVRPAILWIHGGALIMGNRRALHPVQAEKYLNAGYTIISVDYRLAPETKLNTGVLTNDRSA